jgi:hypothetical protein
MAVPGVESPDARGSRARRQAVEDVGMSVREPGASERSILRVVVAVTFFWALGSASAQALFTPTQDPVAERASSKEKGASSATPSRAWAAGMGPTSAIKKPELAEGSRLAVDGHGITPSS